MSSSNAKISKSEATKESIRQAASHLFTERGFTSTGVRDIAAAVGVDPALVNRHFGTKEALFLETMTTSPVLESVLSGPIMDLGERIVRAALEAREGTLGRDVYRALVRASDRPEVRRKLQRLNAALVEGLIDRLPAPDAELRARVFSVQLGGLMNGLWVTEDENLTTSPVDRLVAYYGAALQLTLTGPSPFGSKKG